MTKQAFIESKRLSPVGEAGLAAIRQIVETKTAAKVNEVFIDLFTASALTAVADALRPDLRENLLSRPVGQACTLALKLC